MMKLTAKKPDGEAVDLLVYFVMESSGKMPACQSVPVRKALKQAWKAGDFSGRAGQVFLFYPAAAAGNRGAALRAGRVLVVGLGGPEDDRAGRREQLRLAGGTAAGQAGKLQAAVMLAVLPESTGLDADEAAECLCEGLILGNYRFARYKHKKTDREDEQPGQVEQFILHDGGLPHAAVRRGMDRGCRAARAACTARDMANEPGNSWTPDRFAGFGRELARRSGLKCTVLGRAAMEKLGMGGILAVNQGSVLPPQLVILEYRTGKKNPTLMLVGKGLTFDSGGISLKPAAGMEAMKYDMCGGAAVFTAMQAVAEEKPAGVNLVALVPATENMCGARAVKPGDIITHYNGKTTEVVNTDAEGRLILADALAYGIDRFKPDAVIDLATLTGAVIIGLGHHRTGLLANNDGLADRLILAGELCGEPLWRLPLDKEYAKQLKSEIADLKNVGGRPAGTITAAAYLQEFVGDTAWAHLDIAGTAWDFTKKSYVPEKGPSGVGTRTLLSLIRNWQGAFHAP
ncbi:cytosol aminopeptidase [bacterium BMS3Bbin14]|nr:cytosol aminopeptidase [bacterium BMS3Abin13]GBE53418.1 cytosol aminopeptidase [bacterium BMS3Bbin14]HDO29779.1 leucyl aminopeptidase [Desulfobacteraceae bacterium]